MVRLVKKKHVVLLKNLKDFYIINSQIQFKSQSHLNGTVHSDFITNPENGNYSLDVISSQFIVTYSM